MSGKFPLSRERGYLLDTNVVSEARKTRPNAAVLAFLKELPPEHTFISVLTMGELRKGAALRAKRDPSAAIVIHDWIESMTNVYEERLLGIDLATARLWGELNIDRTRPVIDTLLAATAIHHRLTLVTRNVRDVGDTGVVLHNPWLA